MLEVACLALWAFTTCGIPMTLSVMRDKHLQKLKLPLKKDGNGQLDREN